MKCTESLRVALFLDGKRFYLGWKECSPNCDIDFSRLAKWLTYRVGGGLLTGVYCYYQEFSSEHLTQLEEDLQGFFELLQLQEGLFIESFAARVGHLTCAQCGTSSSLKERKNMDIAIASNMLQLAVADAYDVAVFISDDADYVPVLKAVQLMGKQAYVASWSTAAIDCRIRAAAFGCINLSRNLDAFDKLATVANSSQDTATEELPIAITHFTGEYELDAFMSELAKAQRRFEGGDGYVGLGYFLHYWRSAHLASTPAGRQTVLDRLLVENWVETYGVGDGKLAIQLSERAHERFQEIAAQQ